MKEMTIEQAREEYNKYLGVLLEENIFEKLWFAEFLFANDIKILPRKDDESDV